MKISNIVSTLLLGVIVAFSGCGLNNNDTSKSPASYTYTIKVINLTAGQPMSPVLVSSNHLFSAGESASLGLEKLAEGGDNSELLDANGTSGTGLLTPGSAQTLTFTTTATSLNIATMLVKTNDGFAGLDAYDVSKLAVGDSSNTYMNVYDAGTEANSETNTTVAAFGVEGFNATRDDINKITLHSGVLSKDDGLTTSALSAMEKFDNPALEVIVTRTK